MLNTETVWIKIEDDTVERTEGTDNVPGYNIKKEKYIVDVLNVEPVNRDSSVVGEVTFGLGDVNLTVAVSDREDTDYMSANVPTLRQNQSGYEYSALSFPEVSKVDKIAILRNMRAVAIDAWLLYNLRHKTVEYDDYSTKGCSSCRWKERVEVDAKDMQRQNRLICGLRKELIDKDKQELQDDLNGRKTNQWLMRQDGYIITNPKMSTNSAYSRTLQNLLDGHRMNCEYFNRLFYNEDGSRYSQMVYGQHIPVDKLDLRSEFNRVIFDYNKALGDIKYLIKAIEKLDDLSQSGVRKLLSKPTPAVNKFCKIVENKTGIKANLLKASLEEFAGNKKAQQSRDVLEIKPSKKLARLVHKAGLTAQNNEDDEIETSLDFLLKEKPENIIETMIGFEQIDSKSLRGEIASELIRCKGQNPSEYLDKLADKEEVLNKLDFEIVDFAEQIVASGKDDKLKAICKKLKADFELSNVETQMVYTELKQTVFALLD
jgi:hypothetical protein